jgi:hypothetical protein
VSDTVRTILVLFVLVIVVPFMTTIFRLAWRDWRRGWRPWKGDPPYDYERDGL